MNRSRSLFSLVLAGANLAVGALAFPAAEPAKRLLTAEQWTADLKFLAENLPKTHRHAFDKVTPEAFAKAVADLEAQIPDLDDHEVIVGIARLVALLKDGHSRLTLPMGSGEAIMPGHTPTAPQKQGLYLRVLPVKFHLFSDGLFIQAASKGREDLLGARVLRVGKMNIEAALEAVRPVVSYDSEMWYKNLAPQVLAVPEILHAQRVADSPDRVSFGLILRGGRETTVELEAVDPSQKINWIIASSAAKAPEPLYLSQRNEPFWFEYLPQSQLFYCQVNEVRDKTDETLAQFATRAVAIAEARPLRRFVLDLRLNGGGNNYLNRALVLALVRSSKINRYGTLFAVIGRQTFSAAQSLVNDLEKWTNVIFAGEPTGNSPSQYGDSRKLVLPNSGLTVRLSSLYWRDSLADEKRPWTAPDLAAPLSSTDYLENRDPVLDRILSYQAPASLLGQLEEKSENGGLDSAYFHYYKFRNTPETAAVNTERTLIGMAEYLIGRSKLSDAIGAYEYCLSEYPESFEASLGLGRLYIGQNEREKAIEALKKALKVRPGDAAAQEWLAKAKALKPAEK